MALIIKIQFLILVCSNFVYGDIIYTEDRPYDVIDIRIPRDVWNRAIHPTPVLKSPVTITLPIHVAQEEDNEVDELEDEVQEDVVQEDVVQEDVVQEDEVVPEGSPAPPVEQGPEAVSGAPPPQAPPAPSVTQGPIMDDFATPADDVTGEVTRFPCSCPNGQCGCCTGTILERFNMKACGNISFVPEDFVFDVRLSINNRTVVRRRVSASDPPPICFNPRRAPFVEVCAEISNIRIRNRNAFACLDINANIADIQIYSASFRCFGLGASGVQTGLKPKPVSSGPATVNLFGNNNNNRVGFLESAANTVFGGGQGGGFFGGSQGGLFGGGQGGLFGGGGGGGGLFGVTNLDKDDTGMK